MSLLLSLTASALLAAKPQPDQAPRFALTGSLTAAPVRSLDARFELAASARLAIADPAAGGRFQLKSANGSLGCETGTDQLFKNGFE